MVPFCNLWDDPRKYGTNKNTQSSFIF